MARRIAVDYLKARPEAQTLRAKLGYATLKPSP
jgi:hypothetical protein